MLSGGILRLRPWGPPLKMIKGAGAFERAGGECRVLPVGVGYGGWCSLYCDVVHAMSTAEIGTNLYSRPVILSAASMLRMNCAGHCVEGVVLDEPLYTAQMCQVYGIPRQARDVAWGTFERNGASLLDSADET